MIITQYVKQKKRLQVFIDFRDLVTSTLESHRPIVQETTNEIILSHLWIWGLGTTSPSLITRLVQEKLNLTDTGENVQKWTRVFSTRR